MAKTATKEESNPFSVLGDALESAAETFEEATSNAKSSAKKAAGTTKRAFCNLVHKTAYYSSYGVIYSSVFLTELWPTDNPWRVGLEEGATAAIDDRKKARELKPSKKKEVAHEEMSEEAPKAKSKAKAAKAEPAPAPATRGRKPKAKAPKAAQDRADAFEEAAL